MKVRVDTNSAGWKPVAKWVRITFEIKVPIEWNEVVIQNWFQRCMSSLAKIKKIEFVPTLADIVPLSAVSGVHANPDPHRGSKP